MYSSRRIGLCLFVFVLLNITVYAEISDGIHSSGAPRPSPQSSLNLELLKLFENACELPTFPKELESFPKSSAPGTPPGRKIESLKAPEKLVLSLKLARALAEQQISAGDKNEDLHKMAFHLKRYLESLQRQTKTKTKHSVCPPNRENECLQVFIKDFGNRYQGQFGPAEQTFRQFKATPTLANFRKLQNKIRGYTPALLQSDEFRRLTSVFENNNR